MRFGETPIDEAAGAILAHSHRADGVNFSKGRVLSGEDVARLKEAGVRINYFRTNAPAELEALFARGVDFPLVDDLKPMMAQARRLGIAPLAPVYGNGGAAPAIP